MFAKKLVNLRSIFSWPSFHETFSTCNFNDTSHKNDDNEEKCTVRRLPLCRSVSILYCRLPEGAVIPLHALTESGTIFNGCIADEN